MEVNIQSLKPQKYANEVGMVLAHEINIEFKPLPYNPLYKYLIMYLLVSTVTTNSDKL